MQNSQIIKNDINLFDSANLIVKPKHFLLETENFLAPKIG